MKPIRTLAYALAVMLAALSVQTASAQATQDALYIYRNDGGFNGFFFSDIERIEYSKVDTLGKTQKEYVVQEIYALDSVFRIPLSAIDSVTFVTPETVYKKDVAHTTESKLWDYVTGSDSVKVLKLKTTTPSSLVPKKGDKIVTTKSRKYLPGGFYGVVKSVKTGSKNITVTCEVPNLTDLFDQVVFKAAVEGAPKSSNKVRKASGENATEQEFEIPAVTYYQDLGGGGISYDSFKGSGKIDMGVSHKVNLRAFMAIRWALGMNLDIVQRVETTSWFDLKLSGEVGGSIDLHTYLLNGWKWIPDTPFAIEWEGGFSIGASGKVDLEISRKHVSSSYLMVQYNDSFYDQEHSQCAATFHTLGSEASTSLSGEVSATIGPYFSIYVSLVKKEVGKAGLRFDAGVKAAVAAELSMTDYLLATVPSALSATMMTKPTALYDYLNRDGSLKFGRFFKCDFEAQLANLKQLKYANTLYDNFSTPEKAAVIDFEGGLVPKFSSTKLTYDEEKNTLTAQAALTRKTLGNKVGFAAYYTKSGKRAARSLYKTQYSYEGEKASFNKWSQTFKNLHGGKELTIYPIVTLPLFKYEMLASPARTYKIPAVMYVEPDKIEVTGDAIEERINVTDNLDHDEDKYETTAKIDFGKGVKAWFTGKWDGNDYVLKISKNATSSLRSADITFTTANKDKSINLEKTVTVKQDVVPVMNLSPDKLEFDAKGGKKTVKISETNLTNIKVSTTAKYITVKLSDKTITVTVSENKSKDSRSDYVFVEGKTEMGQDCQAKISVFQSGTGGDDPGPGNDQVVALLDSVYVNIQAFKFGNLSFGMSSRNPKKNITVVKADEGYSVTVVDKTESSTQILKFKLSERQDNGYDYPFKDITDFEYEYAFTNDYNTMASGHYFTKVKFKCSKVPVYASASWPEYYYYQWDGYGLKDFLVTEGSAEHTYVSRTKEVTSENLDLTNAGSILLKAYINK